MNKILLNLLLILLPLFSQGQNKLFWGLSLNPNYSFRHYSPKNLYEVKKLNKSTSILQYSIGLTGGFSISKRSSIVMSLCYARTGYIVDSMPYPFQFASNNYSSDLENTHARIKQSSIEIPILYKSNFIGPKGFFFVSAGPVIGIGFRRRDKVNFTASQSGVPSETLEERPPRYLEFNLSVGRMIRLEKGLSLTIEPNFRFNIVGRAPYPYVKSHIYTIGLRVNLWFKWL